MATVTTSTVNTTEVGAAPTAPTSAPSLAARTRGLRKVYRGTVAVDGVDLEVPDGAVLGMLGPNGSGKTTTIRMLLGLATPTEGQAELFGTPMPDAVREVLPHVGALVEGPGFYPFLSGTENLRRLAGAEPLLPTRAIGRAVDAALERVALTEAASRRYRAYSLGMKQRLGLAAALLVPRKLVVLDEPTNGLDPAGTREIRRVVAELHDEGTTVIVSSHLLAEVEATCTHVAVLQRGCLLAQGELAELLESGNPNLLVSTPRVDAAAETLRDARIAARATADGVLVDLAGTSAPAVLRTLVNGGFDVHEARRQRTGLEELFARLTETDDPTTGTDADDIDEEGVR